MEIITEGFPDDTHNEVLLDRISATYMQIPDCVSGEEDYQEITFETRDGGGGKFINIKTNEHGWSIDQNSDDLLKLIEDFKKRINGSFNNS